MKKRGQERSTTKKIILTVVALAVVFFFMSTVFFNGAKTGNVALISINGMITSTGGGKLGQQTVSSQTVVDFLKNAEGKKMIKAVVLEIDSPGGGAVASDEIGTQIKRMKKPVVAVIRETGASGGYWVASAADHVIANKMSITGSIGVVSSYLEFSGLMKEYGVSYEKLTAGKFKDTGNPYRPLNDAERKLFQGKLDKVHDFFVKEIAVNRKLSEAEVRKVATGEFFLGSEALALGLVDSLGGRSTAEQYLKKKVGIKKVDYLRYEVKKGFFSSLLGVFSEGFFSIGEGIGSVFLREGNKLVLV